MESYYRFKYYSPDKEKVKQVEEAVLNLFEQEGHTDIRKDPECDSESLTTRAYVDNDEFAKLAKEFNVCLFVDYSNDDDSAGFGATLYNNLGESAGDEYYFSYDDEYNESDDEDDEEECGDDKYYNAVEKLRKKIKKEYK